MRFPGPSRSRRAIAVTGVGALAALGLTACIPPGGGGTVTDVFDCTGGLQEWDVPPGVTEATFEVFGAQGGPGSAEPLALFPGGAGGLGGKSTLETTVPAGETLQVFVGCAGADTAGAPGFPGGGEGGELLLGSGGTGGGHSDVRVLTPQGFFPFILAGGGGGGGCGTLLGAGGAGGAGGGVEGTPGDDGTLLIGSIGVVGGGGGQGTQTTSGFMGEGSERGTLDGGPGGPLQGGYGGGTTIVCGGGGGGSGIFGGGGGGASVAGAGGGGGGSGNGVPGTTLETGVSDGDGQVRITYSA